MNVLSESRYNYSSAALIGAALVGTAIYFYSMSGATPAQKSTEETHLATSQTVAGGSIPALNSYRLGNSLRSGNFVADQPYKVPFSAENVVAHLNEFFDRFYAQPPMPQTEIDAFTAQLTSAIEASPETQKRVASFYANIPGNQPMHRNLVRDMLAGSPVGRQMMLDEAKRVWSSKDTSLYQDMYETYYGFRGQASHEIISDAVARLNDTSVDKGTAIAALNLVSTLEKDDTVEGGQLRKAATAQMDSLASGTGDKAVRAVAAQKLYQLSTPERAADAAAGYLQKDGSNPLLLRLTLDAINSGDVELTPALRSTLSNTMTRASTDPAQRKHFSELVSGRSASTTSTGSQ
ncbi:MULTISPECIES: hypothetical protein [Xanthomonas]|uniref:hypothetical protein n=1 Tax=Xanthomonas TaxID=338 RepID=UPI0012900052|nr:MULTISPECIES: hypothetical protein [Xanthomonas]